MAVPRDPARRRDIGVRRISATTAVTAVVAGGITLAVAGGLAVTRTTPADAGTPTGSTSPGAGAPSAPSDPGGLAPSHGRSPHAHSRGS